MCVTLDLHFLNDTANIFPLNHVGKDIKKDINLLKTFTDSSLPSSVNSFPTRRESNEK